MKATRMCSIEGCDRPTKGRGWCNRHYQRWYATGSAEDPTPDDAPALDGEEWRPVGRCHPAYEVSNMGRVRSTDRMVMRNGHPMRQRGRILRQVCGSGGYMEVSLHRDGKGETSRVHVLVAEAFVGRGKPGEYVLHRDGDQRNNTPENLYYGDQSRNNLDAVRHGTHFHARKTHCPQGHPYDAANTSYHTRGNGRSFRMCKTCARERSRARWARKNAEIQ